MPEKSFRLPGEIAVITGAGSGIGLTIADHLTKAGVDVSINDLDEEALGEAERQLERNKGRLLTQVGDASEPGMASDLVEATAEQFGGVDILVNNVGIAGPTKPCEDITTGEFLETIEVNLGAMFATSKAAIPHLREGKEGRIVNLSSMSGKRPLLDRTPYTTSKMGVIGFTRTLATELATDGITVNAVCPGSVEGDRLDAVLEGQARSQDQPVAEVEREFRNVSPMEQFVQAGDVANAVLYLCSERAGRVTGQDLNVTAGIVMY
jgi:NAD(P)-dependent dehydrogenase (short-subunit alcohol dehydrogenase family)